MPRRRKTTPTRLEPLLVKTTDLLNWVHKAQESDKVEVRNAADSLRSLVAYKLRDEYLYIDSDMMAAYAVIYEAFNN